MKKLFTLVLLVFSLQAFTQVVIVDWNFPDGSADAVADSGTPENLDRVITTEGGTGAMEFKNGFEGKAAQAAGWDNGNGLKCWVVSFSSAGYDLLTLSSKLTSGGNDPGPKDWKVEYRLGTGGVWTEVPGSTLVNANDWTTGVLDNLSLPEACNDKNDVYLRWIMTSDSNTAGGLVEPVGKCKIDNILVLGHAMNSVPESPLTQLSVYPNPATDHFIIDGMEGPSMVEICDASGRWLVEKKFDRSIKVSAIDLPSGVYFLRIRDLRQGQVVTKKVVVQ